MGNTAAEKRHDTMRVPTSVLNSIEPALGWQGTNVESLDLRQQAVQFMQPWIHDGARLVLAVDDAAELTAVCNLLQQRGFDRSVISVLDGDRVSWSGTVLDCSRWAPKQPIQFLGVEFIVGENAVRQSRAPGLPDETYGHEGYMTRRELRAVTMAYLAPSAGELLWDVGAGAGTVAIEWMRLDRSHRAVAIEGRSDRVERLRHNAFELGVPNLSIVHGDAPSALAGLPTPDAIFLGGGFDSPDVFSTSWNALRPGGRVVAHALSMDAEAELVAMRRTFGGNVVQISAGRVLESGEQLVREPAVPTLLWSVEKPCETAYLAE